MRKRPAPSLDLRANSPPPLSSLSFPKTMTDDRPIPSRFPSVETVKPGNYFFCTCGRSAGQPFCDGSHAGSGYAPEKVVIEEERKVAWCNCKRSAKGAFCDGSHAQLPRD
jgi:CDGSH-type Zn-finger protein